MTIICDICGNVYKDKQPGYYVTGTICNKCYNLKDIDELKKVVKQRIERTKKRLKVLEELGFEMTEIKGKLDSFEERLEKEVVVAVFKTKIINFFTKVSTLETSFLFTGMEDKIPEFINENEILTNETKELKNQVKNLKGKEVELKNQINRLNEEIEELKENTNTLTNEKKKLKNQKNQLENLKGKEVELTDQIDVLWNENKKLKNKIKNTEKKIKDIKEQKREEGFQDDFSDKSRGWREYSDEDIENKYEDGEFHMLVKKKGRATWSDIQEAYSNFIIEVDARQVSGPVAKYGLVFRKEDHKFYRFNVSNDGKYSIDKLLKEGAEGWKIIKNWTESRDIKKGKEINRLKVIAHGSQIMVFVNDKYLATVTDSSFVKGCVGMAVSAYDKPNVHVHFNNFKVSPIG